MSKKCTVAKNTRKPITIRQKHCADKRVGTSYVETFVRVIKIVGGTMVRGNDCLYTLDHYYQVLLTQTLVTRIVDPNAITLLNDA